MDTLDNLTSSTTSSSWLFNDTTTISNANINATTNSSAASSILPVQDYDDGNADECWFEDCELTSFTGIGYLAELYLPKVAAVISIICSSVLISEIVKDYNTGNNGGGVGGGGGGGGRQRKTTSAISKILFSISFADLFFSLYVHINKTLQFCLAFVTTLFGSWAKPSFV